MHLSNFKIGSGEGWRNWISIMVMACLVGTILSGCGQVQEKRTAPPAPWRSILQGMELTGFHTDGPGEWRVARRGSLLGTSEEGTEPGWIFTNTSYANFNLRFAYRLDEGATAGVAVRTPGGTDPVARRGYEILLGKDVDDWAGVGTVVGIQPSRRPRASEETGGLHSCQINAVGDRISVFIDSRKKADIHDRKSLQGAIGFKLPTNGSIWIFDLELQPLPDSGPLPPTLETAMNQAPGEFVDIMPGPNLEGWKMLWPEDGRWYYEGEVLVATDVTRNTWIFTEKDFRDYILRLEFNLERGHNGGTIYRYPRLPEGERPGGPQARAEETEIGFSNNGEPGALHDRITVLRGVSKPGEWNLFEEYCYDDRIAVYINGTKVTDWHNAVAREGAIGIQAMNARSTVRYRNLEVKEMPQGFLYP